MWFHECLESPAEIRSRQSTLLLLTWSRVQSDGGFCLYPHNKMIKGFFFHSCVAQPRCSCHLLYEHIEWFWGNWSVFISLHYWRRGVGWCCIGVSDMDIESTHHASWHQGTRTGILSVCQSVWWEKLTSDRTRSCLWIERLWSLCVKRPCVGGSRVVPPSQCAPRVCTLMWCRVCCQFGGVGDWKERERQGRLCWCFGELKRHVGELSETVVT